MTKRIAALLIAVIIPITLIFTGCGSTQLTTQEYYDQLYADFKEYVADLKEVSEIQTSAPSVSTLQSQKEKAEEICEKAEKTLDKFTKMNPPSQFADKHKKLVSAVELEKKFVKATAKIFTAGSESELLEYTNEAEKIFDGISEEQQFATIFMELFLEVKSELEGEQ